MPIVSAASISHAGAQKIKIYERLLSDKDKVALARELLLGVLDPDMALAVLVVARDVDQHGQELLKYSFERECG